MNADQNPAENVIVRDGASSPEDVQTWRKQLVQGVVRAVALVGPLAAVAGSYYDYRRGVLWTLPVYWGLCVLLLLVAFLRRIPYAPRAGVLMMLLYGVAVLDFLGDGRNGSGRVFLVLLPVMAGLLFGLKGSVRALVLTLLTMIGFAWAYSSGRLTVAQEASSSDPFGWLSNTFVVMMLGVLGTVSLNYLVPHLSAALTQSRDLAQELEEHRAKLEEQVAERTADLARRSTQLEMAAWVAREAAAIRDAEQLLEETVRLISDRFGFYHTGIFLLDDAKEYAVLRAASSDGGQRMLARRHRLKVGEVGIVGYVTGRGEPRVALDVGEDAVFFNNPDLPDTRSEMALPLQARGEIIGALDVQSREPEAFSEEDVAVLQTLADQVALAISNTRLFQRAQDGLKAARRAYSELSREAWLELMRGAVCQDERQRSNLFTAAFFAPKASDNTEQVPTNMELAALEKGESIPLPMQEGIADLADKHSFFHWHLAFPEVYEQGGFDVLLGNPPWDVSQLAEEEYFSVHAPSIAQLSGAKRKAAIALLEEEKPKLWKQYQSDKQSIEARNQFFRSGGRNSLTAKGKLNLYSLFAEHFLNRIGSP